MRKSGEERPSRMTWKKMQTHLISKAGKKLNFPHFYSVCTKLTKVMYVHTVRRQHGKLQALCIVRDKCKVNRLKYVCVDTDL